METQQYLDEIVHPKLIGFAALRPEIMGVSLGIHRERERTPYYFLIPSPDDAIGLLQAIEDFDLELSQSVDKQREAELAPSDYACSLNILSISIADLEHYSFAGKLIWARS